MSASSASSAATSGGFCRKPRAPCFSAQCAVSSVDGEDVHGDVPDGRVVLEPVEHRPAVHAGQVDVERDGAGLELARQREAGLALGGDDHLEPVAAWRGRSRIRVKAGRRR